MEVWVGFTLLAAFMQTIRTAGQKKLSGVLSPMATTFVRYLYGLPFVLIYLFIVLNDMAPTDVINSAYSVSFLTYASLASVAQILATYWLVKLFTMRNFAIGTIFTKSEVIQTALLGVVFFSAFLSVTGWVAILLGLVGIVLISIPTTIKSFDFKSAKYGLMSGLAFSFCALWLREASLSLDFSFIQNASITVAYCVFIQTIMCFFYIYLRENQQLKLLMTTKAISIFVGATSALGSIGWYTAMTYENAALVKSLGQIELLFAVVVTYFFFNEKITVREGAGFLCIAASILILLLFV